MFRRTRQRLAPTFSAFIQTKPALWLLSLFEGTRRQIRRLYAWVVGMAEKKGAEKALVAISAAESSFFPIPPDPLLIAMVTAKPEKYLRFATICTLASVVGGIVGYIIGAALFDTAGTWIINTYDLHEQFVTVSRMYDDYAFWAVFAAAFSPIPYKLFTVAAGVFSVNFPLFVLASFIGRGGRFFLVATLMHHFGKRYKDKIEKYIDILSLAFVALLVLGILAVHYLL